MVRHWPPAMQTAALTSEITAQSLTATLTGPNPNYNSVNSNSVAFSPSGTTLAAAI